MNFHSICGRLIGKWKIHKSEDALYLIIYFYFDLKQNTVLKILLEFDKKNPVFVWISWLVIVNLIQYLKDNYDKSTNFWLKRSKNTSCSALNVNT